jgi:hypothetical protein
MNGSTLVRQEHDYGCGLASLAMIDGKSYEDVRQWLITNWPGGQADGGAPPENWLEKRGIYSGIADWYLGHHGYVWRKVYSGWAKDKPSFQWPPAPFAPVHLVQVRQPSGNSHYVVMRADGVVLDPMTDEPRSLTDWPLVDNVMGAWRCPGPVSGTAPA